MKFLIVFFLLLCASCSADRCALTSCEAACEKAATPPPSQAATWCQQKLTSIGKVDSSSETYVSWCLSILGGSILVLINDGYLKPKEGWHRLAFLPFLPGWFFLGMSIERANAIKSQYLGMLQNPTNLSTLYIGDCMAEGMYSSMRQYFLVALAFFAAWLVITLALSLTNSLKKPSE